MISVSDLIAELSKYPPDARCYAYEGEICGIIITQGDIMNQIGEIIASEYDP